MVCLFDIRVKARSRVTALVLGVVGLAACHNEPAPRSGDTAAAASGESSQSSLPSPSAGEPLGAAAQQAGAPAPPPGPMTVSDKDCPADFTIDDAEDGNNQILLQGGRKGYWYTFVDKAGSTLSPPAGTKFIMSSGGPKDSHKAARMIGKVSSNGDPLFAGMGFSLTDPKGAYDASTYTGVSFYAKVGAGSTKAVRLKVPDVDTDPVGKRCTECFNDFGADLTLTEQWKKYTVPFATMKQMEGWGSPSPSSIDKSKVYGLQWQVAAQGANYDVWIDDVQFTGCP
ncbi:MAG TPA: carbohydrate binding domain-containing protein [Polyangiaceae bacterium]|nr:carbohydrate binding domain-containing protein [Polyangiaceae bacterium]